MLHSGKWTWHPGCGAKQGAGDGEQGRQSWWKVLRAFFPAFYHIILVFQHLAYQLRNIWFKTPGSWAAGWGSMGRVPKFH